MRPPPALDELQADIARVVSERARLMAEMEQWYAAGRCRFPRRADIEALDARLSTLDSQFKLLWDATHRQARG